MNNLHIDSRASNTTYIAITNSITLHCFQINVCFVTDVTAIYILQYPVSDDRLFLTILHIHIYLIASYKAGIKNPAMVTQMCIEIN